MANANLKTDTPLAGASLAATDRIVIGDVSADGFVTVIASELAQAVVRLMGSQTLTLPSGTFTITTADSSDFKLIATGGGAVHIENCHLVARQGIDGWDGNRYGFAITSATTTTAGLKSVVEGVIQVNNGTTGAAGFAPIPNTPAQIAGDVNDYSPGVGQNQRWSSDVPRNVTGMVAGAAGETRFIWNVGAQDIVLKNANASSAAANRFTTSTGENITLVANKCAMAMYDATSAVWRVTLLP